MRSLLLAILLAGPAHATEPAPSIDLLLHDPTGRNAPSKGCDVALCTRLVSLLDGATTSIDFALYGLRGQPAIFEALTRAKARGVAVRGIIDRSLDGTNYYGDSEALVAALGTVRDDLTADRVTADRKAREPAFENRCWRDRPEGFLGPAQCLGYDLGDQCLLAVHASREALSFQGDIMHNKFFVVDQRWVWLGSTNTSDSGTGGYNANAVAIVDAPEVAGWYTHEFNQMYDGKFHRAKQAYGGMRAQLGPDVVVEGYFSPQDRPITKVVRKLVQEATERIDVAIFFLTHKGLTADLIAAHRRGVKVRIVLDATSATNGYTKHELARVAGIPVKVEAWGGKMHMKAAAIDGQHVIVGSMNWTSAGEWGNDENTLVLHSPTHAAQFHTWYDTLWTHVPDRWLVGRPDPESRDSGTACTDGSDNDFDHLRDDDDPGCSDAPPPLSALPPYTLVPKEDGHGLVKGNISQSSGRRSYFIPTDDFYDRVTVDTSAGEAWFCSEEDARAAGFRPVGR